MSRYAGLLAISLLLATGARDAAAQNAGAEALFTDGEKLFAEGKLAEACEAFAASNRIESRAGTLINLGTCREANKQYASAWVAFKDALTRVKDPGKKKTAQAKVTALEARMSYLTISVPDESRIEGLVVLRDGQPLDVALWNRAIPADGGKVTIAGKAPGHEEWSTTVEIKDEKDKVSVDVPRFKELGKLVPPPVKPEGKPDLVIREEPPPSPSPPMSGKRRAAIGLGVVGVGAIATGVFLGLKAKSLEDEAFGICADPDAACPEADRANDLLEKGSSRALLANIAFGVGAVATVGAVILWIKGKPQTESQVTVVPRATGDAVGLELLGRF